MNIRNKFMKELLSYMTDDNYKTQSFPRTFCQSLYTIPGSHLESLSTSYCMSQDDDNDSHFIIGSIDNLEELAYFINETGDET